MPNDELALGFIVIFGFFFLVGALTWLSCKAEKIMPSPSNVKHTVHMIGGGGGGGGSGRGAQGHAPGVVGNGGFGTVSVCTTVGGGGGGGGGYSSMGMNIKGSDTLLVFRTYEATKRNLIGQWLSADKTAFFDNVTGNRWKTIIIMPYECPTQYEQDEIDKYIRDYLPTKLEPGGRILNLNDPELKDEKCPDTPPNAEDESTKS